MSDIFISYSRKDKTFVTRLSNALVAAGRNVWLDVKDIPPTAEWEAEIYGSIEAADNFIFVISPDSLRSEICARELAHAVTHNKRLVPIVCREPAGEKSPPALAKLHWIFFRSDDPFDESLAQLQNALDTDLNYVRLHTRLLVRANEWQARRRSGSFTLRGEDLREAEAWLVEGAEKEPRPTQLQVEYITFSRQAERTRQRRTLSLVVIALILTTSLAIAAVWQSQVATSREHARATQQSIAEEQRRVAEEERRIALSSKLATQSRLLFDEQLDLSLLLAVLSGQINATAEASSTLHDALEHRPDLLQYLNGVPPGGITQMAYTADGQQLVAVGADGAIWRWELSTGKPVGDPIQKAGQQVLGIKLGPQGETWVIGLDASGVFIWEASGGSLIGPPIVFSDDRDGDGEIELPQIAALSPDGTTLAVAVFEDISIWDVHSGELIGESDVLLGYPPSALEFSPDQKTVASAGNEWQIYFWDPLSGSNLGRYQTSQTRNITSLAFSADGVFIASGSEDGTINLFDLTTGEQRMRQPLYSITTGQEIPPPALGHPAAVRSVVLSPDGSLLISGAQDGNMLIWDTNTLNPLTILKPAYVGAILALTYHPNGDSFAAGGENASITIWGPDETWRLSRPRTDAEREMEFSYPQAQVEGVREEDRWRLIHQVSGYSAVSGCTTPVEAYEACPEGFVEAYQADGQLIDLQPAHIMNLPEHTTFNADGTKLAVTACQTLSGYNCLNSIWIWSLPDGTVKEIATSIVRINHLLFSPDGRYLAYGGEGRDIMLFDLSNDRETRLPLLNWPGQVTDLRFSPDGTRLAASASFEDPGPYANTINHGRIMVWDTASGSAIAHSSMRGWMVAGLGFSEDGQVLQFAIQEGPGEGDGDPGPIWLLGLEQWQQIACRIANRDLTEREWQRYVIGEEYRQVCT